LKCLHDEILTKKDNIYRQISNYWVLDYSQGVPDRQYCLKRKSLSNFENHCSKVI